MRDDSIERAVIGALLVHPEWADDLVGLCSASDFAARGLAQLYTAVAATAERDGQIDYVDVMRRLGPAAELVGGMSGIDELSALIPPSRRRAVEWAMHVHRMARVRELAEEATRVAEDARRATDPIAFVEGVQRRLDPLLEVKTTGPQLLRGRMHGLLADAMRGEGRGVPTGFRDVDAVTTGVTPGTVTIIGARPSHGKSALMLAVALRMGVPVLFSSLEMSEVELATRLASTLAGVPFQAIQSGRMSPGQRAAVARAASEIERMPLAIDDDCNVTISDLRNRARAFYRDHCRRVAEPSLPMLWVVDYLQLITPLHRHGTRDLEIGEISRGLKKVSRELGCMTMVGSQLGRAVEERKPPRPKASDLRESGNIEQDADHVLMLWRPEKYDTRTEHVGRAEVIVDKWRNGPTGSVWLTFDGPTMTFDDEPRQPPQQQELGA